MTMLQQLELFESKGFKVTDDFGDFEVVVETKPQPGTIQGVIPEKLAKFLSEKVKEVIGSADKELVLKADSEKNAKRLALYARAWGAQQEPKLRITKLPNRKDTPDSVARLNVVKDEDVPAENRPGRKPSK